MNLEEAGRILEAAFPCQGVVVKVMAKGSFQVVKPNGEVLGAAFDLKTALQQACRPVLQAEAQRRVKNQKERAEELKDFILFLQERYASEFISWREARKPEAEAPPSGEQRAEPDQVKLVSIV